MKKNDINIIALIALLVAVTTLIFGNNIYQQITGHSYFQKPSSTTDPAIENIVQQTLQALTASASSSTSTNISNPSPIATKLRAPTNTPIPSFSPTVSPQFSVTDVNFTVSGQCGNFNIAADITTNGNGSVEYHWIWSDGAIDNTEHPPIAFATTGTKRVSTTWFVSVSGAHWIDIYIDSPNHQRFGRANFSCP